MIEHVLRGRYGGVNMQAGCIVTHGSNGNINEKYVSLFKAIILCFSIRYVEIIDFGRCQKVVDLAAQVTSNTECVCPGLDSSFLLRTCLLIYVVIEAQSYFVSLHRHLDVTIRDSTIICDYWTNFPSLPR